MKEESIKTWQLYKDLFAHKDTFFCFVSLLLQQILVAASTYFIIKLGEAIALHGAYSGYLTLFVASLIIVYIPGIFYLLFLNKAQYEAIHRFVHLFISANKNQIAHYSSPEYRKDKEPWLTSEGISVVQEASSIVTDGIAILLNVLLNALTIAIFVEKSMLLAYGASFFILWLSVVFAKKPLQTMSTELQVSQVNMQNTLLNAWDNILIQNQYNFTGWLNLFQQTWNHAKEKSIKYAIGTNLFSSLAMLLAMLPVLAIIIISFYKHANDWAILSALIVTLPRQLQILQNIFSVFSYSVHWTGFQAKMAGLAKSVTNQLSLSPSERISWKKLSFIDNHNNEAFSVTSLDSLIHKIKNSTGRITVRGPNGAGKSTLFCLLKKELGNTTFYLPASSNLYFNSTWNKNLSSGEKVKIIFSEIAEEAGKIPYLLLDEWDANLDEKNRYLISYKINELARTTSILEIRHHS